MLTDSFLLLEKTREGACCGQGLTILNRGESVCIVRIP